MLKGAHQQAISKPSKTFYINEFLPLSTHPYSILQRMEVCYNSKCLRLKLMKVSKKQQALPQFGLYVNNLWSALTLLDSKEEVRDLVRDLFTHTEYKMFAKRLEIARRLLAQQPYEEIIKELNVSGQSVATVSNVLALRGDGLRRAHERLFEMEEKYSERRRQKLPSLKASFSKLVARRSVLAPVLRVGLAAAHKKVSQKIKRVSARHVLKT